MCSTSAIGIDLGTTFSCVSVFQNGRPEIIKCQGRRTTPSTVFFHNEKQHISVGVEAQDEASRCFQNEVFDVKRIIGRKFNDCYVQNLIKSGNYPFSISKGYEDEACIQVDYKGRQITKSPESISSQVLSLLRNAATDYLGTEVTEAVISVPAYFSNAQRKATKKAAELAGLRVLRFISEPVAAAVQYTYGVNKSETHLVFDFGGGTVDVSIIKVDGKKYEVKAVNGDTALGGRDIDNILTNKFKSLLEDPHDPKLFRRLKINCIKLKMKLSVPRDASVEVEQSFFYNNKDYSLAISRKTFDNLNKDIFDRAIDIVETCLFKADMKKTDIDEVILVGGSCNNLKIQDMLQEYFQGKKLRKDIDPDEAIALGACIQAAVLKSGNGELENYQIIEVTPLSLGLDSYGNLMTFLIPRNTPLPASRSRSRVTVSNDQTEVTFRIYEGERSQTVYNNKLGEFTVTGLPKKKAGEVEFATTFKLDEDGILQITASETTTGKSESLVVSMGNFHLCEYQVNKSLKEALKNKSEDEIFRVFTEARNQKISRCNSVIYDSQNIIDDKDRYFLQTECKSFISLAESIDFHDMGQLITEFNKLSKSIAPTMKKHLPILSTSDYNEFINPS